MSNHEIPGTPEDYAARLEAALVALQGHSRQIEFLKAESSRTWSEVSDLVKQLGVTEDVKFLVAAFAGYPTNPEKTRTYIEKLKEVDEAVKHSAGQLVAWLTSEEVDTSTSFNPSIEPSTEVRYDLHLGLLPRDARLIVPGSIGQITVRVEKSATVPLNGIYLRDEPLTFDNELHPLPSYESSNFVRLEESSVIEVSRWSPEHPYPLLTGDSAVENLVKGNLKGNPEAEKALDLLTVSLF